MPDFSRLPVAARWGLLLALSVALSAVLQLAHLPAALLLGAMAGGIMLAVFGGAVKPPAFLLEVAQAVIGAMIARTFTPAVVSEFAREWPLFLAVVVSTVVASSGLGFLVGKLKSIPGSTAIWGMLPGAASAMMLMADAFGADARLVAFMQYMRVIVVAICASAVARFWVHAGAPGGIGSAGWFPAVDWPAFAATLGLVAASIGGSKAWKRLPAGAMLIAMFGGGALHVAGVLPVELPPWLLAPCYMLLGWMIGLRFTRDVLAAAARALPQTLFSIVLLVSFCGAVAYLLVRFAGVDPLTAYLATSPGGADSVAIIGAASHADLSFVMTLQTVRLIIVIVLGPPFSRFLARKAGHVEASRASAGG